MRKVLFGLLTAVFCVGLVACGSEVQGVGAVKVAVEEQKAVVDSFMGDWQGSYETDTGDWGQFDVQMIALGDGKYRMRVLEMFDTNWEPIFVADATRDGEEMSFVGTEGMNIRGEGVFDGKVCKGEFGGENSGAFQMKRVVRLSPKLRAEAPKGAVVLFDGKSLDGWERIGGFAGMVDLAHLVGGDNAAAYMSSSIHSQKDLAAVLELGSDDGVKVWVNGKVVHVNDVARGVTPGQDKVNVRLKKGWNELMLKVTNGGGGWGACARMVGADGKPLGNIAERIDGKGSRKYLEANSGFLTAWNVTGPYRIEGKGPSELLSTEMGPELAGKECKWIDVAPKGDPKTPQWKLVDGAMEVGSGSIKTKRVFRDFKLHIEFKTPFMPKARGQGRGNSGVYLQNRYEVQVLDSYGLEGLDNECGGIYKVARPRVNMCAPPGQWQSYDMTFRAPVFDNEGNKTDKARLTVVHNGVTIHDDIEIPGLTGGALDNNESEPGGIYLQDHGNPVQYGNVWVVEMK